MILMDCVSHIHNNTLITMDEIVHSLTHIHTQSNIIILMDGVPHIHTSTLILMNEIVHSLTQIHIQYHHGPDGWCTTHTQQHTDHDE